MVEVIEVKGRWAVENGNVAVKPGGEILLFLRIRIWVEILQILVKLLGQKFMKFYFIFVRVSTSSVKLIKVHSHYIINTSII